MENDNISKHSGLMSAIRHYSNPQTCIDEVAAVKWPSGQAVCPRCSSKRATYLATRLLWKCKDCKKQFSVKVGTIFEDSAVGLDKWLCAMWMMANCKNGVSSYEIGKSLEVTQKTAWFMMHRIRYATIPDRSIKCPAPSKRMRHSSAARHALCTSTSAMKKSTVAALAEKKLCSACFNEIPVGFASITSP